MTGLLRFARNDELKKNKIYNIPAANSFVDVLAERFLAEYRDKILELVDVIFLVPNRRTCQALKDAFLREQGLKPLMLPKIVSIGDASEDEILFFDQGLLKDLSPPIDRLERTLLFTKIIMARPMEFGLKHMSARQASFLAAELAGLIDMANYEGLTFEGLKNLVPEEYAAHWQETLKFLEIITKHWPDILEERELVDPSFRYNQLLWAQAKIWQETKTEKRIVIAGASANFPAVKEVVKTVLSLQNGEFYINGLDKELEDEAWEELDETHPSYEIKALLEELGINRFEVRDIGQRSERERLISEVMRPAKTTDKWRDIKAKSISHMAWSGVSVVECESSREEAMAVAMIMREALETPEKTTALVTGDRNLARRVATELERWDIKVDDSAGRPLSLTPVGIFMRLLIEVAVNEFSSVSLLSLCKHPFTGGDRKAVREYEKNVLRNPDSDGDVDIFIKAKMMPLQELLTQDKVSLKELVKQHIEVAAEVAEGGDNTLWRGEAGEAAAKFFANLYEQAESLGEIRTTEYAGLLEALMVQVMVRSVYGTHPRLKILGPIEARFNAFDVVIIGGVNEGIWPKSTTADPWMSRPMKKDFGFPLPEKNIGIMAKDFADLLANREVYITRAERVDGTPMIKSRWLLRLETVIQALGLGHDAIENNIFVNWVRKFDEVLEYKKISPPAPTPPVSARPRKLSASGIDSLIRDPYIVFARYILRLKKLGELDPDVTAADYGNIIHGILDEFNKKFGREYPDNAEEELLVLGKKHFDKSGIALETRAFWWPKFERVVMWLVKKEQAYRQDIVCVHSEIEGSLEIDAPAGKFLITAKADRVDETVNGKINIVDFKTGQARTKKEVAVGYAPQLPIEGLIAVSGGYKNVPAKEVESLIYWKLGDKEIVVDENVGTVLEDNLANIKDVVGLFDFETTGYMSKPNPKYVTANRDYEHLARVKEWSVAGDGDE